MSVLSRRRTSTAIAGLLLAFSTSARADRPEDIRAQLVYVASALSSGNPSDALGPIDKSFKDYSRLRDFFVALTQAYQVASEVDITDEDDRETETKLEVTWRLTLTEPATNVSSQRSADVKLTLAQKDGKWKIVDLSPVDFFNPQGARP